MLNARPARQATISERRSLADAHQVNGAFLVLSCSLSLDDRVVNRHVARGASGLNGWLAGGRICDRGGARGALYSRRDHLGMPSRLSDRGRLRSLPQRLAARTSRGSGARNPSACTLVEDRRTVFYSPSS